MISHILISKLLFYSICHCKNLQTLLVGCIVVELFVCAWQIFPSFLTHSISNCASSNFFFPSWPDPLQSEQVVDQWAYKRLGQSANCTNTHKHPERTLAYRNTYLHCCRSLPLVTSARVWIQLFPGRTRIILCDKKNTFARVLFLQVLTPWTLTHIRGLQGLDDSNVFFLPGSLNLFFQHSAQSAFTTAGLTMEQLKTAVWNKL